MKLHSLIGLRELQKRELEKTVKREVVKSPWLVYKEIESRELNNVGPAYFSFLARKREEMQAFLLLSNTTLFLWAHFVALFWIFFPLLFWTSQDILHLIPEKKNSWSLIVIYFEEIVILFWFDGILHLFLYFFVWILHFFKRTREKAETFLIILLLISNFKIIKLKY